MLQELLNAKIDHALLPNGRPLAEDGDFGRNTKAAVKTFQQLNDLVVDGIVGRNTWTQLGVEWTGGGTGGSVPGYGPTPPTAPGEPPVGPEPPPVNDVPGAQWMETARGEIGVSEVSGSAHNPRILEYHATTTLDPAYAGKDETAWCSSFANWCMQQVGITGTNSAWAAGWLNWGQSTNARSGAVAVVYDPQHAPTNSGNHVAFLVEETGSAFVLLGGNQSNQVKISHYSKSRWQLKGYRWPNG